VNASVVVRVRIERAQRGGDLGRDVRAAVGGGSRDDNGDVEQACQLRDGRDAPPQACDIDRSRELDDAGL
jgi:hypothetical protein